MLYFPTEHDWTQSVWSDRIPLDKCFLGKFAVNNLPIHGSRQGWQPKAGPWKWNGKGNAPPPQNGPNRRLRPVEKANHSFPNSIPLNKDSRQLVGKPVIDKMQDPYKQPGWLEEIKEQITRLLTSKGHDTLGATSQT